jgi:glycosyltransferase involved in cell wall biosynthesis
MDAVHLTTAHNSTDTRIFDKEARSLVKAGFKVGIIAHDAPEEPIDGVNFYSLGTSLSRTDRWKNIIKAVRIAKRTDARIIHIHDVELLPAAIYLSKTTDNVVIYDVHEDYGHIVATRDWVPDTIAPLASWMIPQVERIAVNRLDATIPVSQWIGEPFEDLANDITIVHNYPRTETIPEVSGSIDSTTQYTLCYVGGLVDVRGIHRMLELVETLVDRGVNVELWALGSWMPAANKTAADEFIKENNLQSRVKFPGYLEYDEMFRHLHSADVGLALLDTEHYRHGIPTKLFEYLYAGLPIVTTPTDAVAEFIPDEYCHLVPQGDTEAAADAVETALQENYDESEMRTIIEEKYSWEHEAEKLINLYEKLLEDK